MFSDLETKFMGLQSKFTDAAAATIAKSSDLASLRREIMAMETIQQVGLAATPLAAAALTLLRTSKRQKRSCRRSWRL